MPFQSKAQRALLWAKRPAVAREFAAATPWNEIGDWRDPPHIVQERMRQFWPQFYPDAE